MGGQKQIHMMMMMMMMMMICDLGPSNRAPTADEGGVPTALSFKF